MEMGLFSLVAAAIFSLLFPCCRSEHPSPSRPASVSTLIQGASHGGGGFTKKTFFSNHHCFHPPAAAALPLLLSPMGGMLWFGAPRVSSSIWYSSGRAGEHPPPHLPGTPSFAVTPSRLPFPRTARLHLGSAAPPRAVCGVCVSVCAHVCRTWCCLLVTPVLRGHGWVGMWPVGRGLQGRPRCVSDTVQLGFQVTERALGSFLSPCQFCRPRHSPVGISPHCSSPKPRRGCSSRPRVPGRRQLGHLGQAAHQTGDFYPHDPF